ncbi:MAG: amidohydrolase [Ignavibacteria bacterium]|nr:amidohydrolase [Ignavibacteria bacterium]
MSRYLAMLMLIFIASCSKQEKTEVKKDPNAAVMYYNGDIITMEGDEPKYVESVVVKDGKILFAGESKEAMKQAGKGHVMVDLKGKTMLPGFIDGHSHILMYAAELMNGKLNPPPIGNVTSIADVISEMKRVKAELKASDTTWLLGSGYDQDFLAENRHPTAEDLDGAFPTNPVLLLHSSGHMLVANSAALKKVGIDKNTKDPEGGTIIRKKGTNIPEGLIQEMGMLPFSQFMSNSQGISKDLELLQKAVDYYASCGVTTANEGMLLEEKLPLIQSAAGQGNLKIDIIALPAFTYAKDVAGTGKITWGKYDNHVKYGGIKMSVDGSPQGKTAYLSKPYLTKVPGCNTDCRGFPNLSQDQVNELFLLCYSNNIQLFSHCNGDASTDMMIKGHENAIKVLNDSVSDRRTVIVHSQIMRPDQLDSYKRYKLFPTFFTNHTFYWGDVHLANLGEERASFISPMSTAKSKGIVSTNHTDCTVTPMDQMFLLWTSVNRVTRSGKVLGESEKISPYDGLKALTINGAYEYFEEASKGSLKAGKLADLVILDKNPLKVDPMSIKDIKVVETIKEGKTVYERKAGN